MMYQCISVLWIVCLTSTGLDLMAQYPLYFISVFLVLVLKTPSKTAPVPINNNNKFYYYNNSHNIINFL